MVYRMLRDSSSVDDVAQDIFLKVYRQMGKFQRRASFSTWLTRIAVNHCINCLKGQRRFLFFPSGIRDRDSL
ncbi:MAG: RNA polymerase sigma factor, partial [Candidatus Thorarchaeota archaeon]